MKRMAFVFMFCSSLAHAFPSTFYIQSTSALQSGATFYVSSGTVSKQFNVNDGTNKITLSGNTLDISQSGSQPTANITLFGTSAGIRATNYSGFVNVPTKNPGITFQQSDGTNLSLYIRTDAGAVPFVIVGGSRTAGGVTNSGILAFSGTSGITGTDDFSGFTSSAGVRFHTLVWSLPGFDANGFLQSDGSLHLSLSPTITFPTTFSNTVTMSSATITGQTTVNTLLVSGANAPPNSQALCFSGGQLGHCTSAVGAGGACTCSAP